MKKNGGVRSRKDTCGGSCGLLVQIFASNIVLVEKKNIRIGVLVPNLGVLDDEFEVFLVAGKLSKVQSWYKNLGLYVQTNRYTVIT